jgi:hypothetical protein
VSEIMTTPSNIGLEPAVSRVMLLAKKRKRRATRPAAQPGRWVDLSLMAFDEARERQTIKVTEPE